MAQIQPFRALRPNPDRAARVCELPYDVLSSEEARRAAAGNPLSFFHVSKAEIDLPAEIDPHSPQVYAQARENFDRLRGQKALVQDERACFYVYRQVMGAHSQLGLVGAASCQEYLSNQIRKHELTRPDKEDDRVRHMEALDAQTGPVFLLYPSRSDLDQILEKTAGGVPEIDFTSADGVRHSSWVIGDSERISAIRAEFEAVENLYIADGHHRSAAAGRVYRSRNGAGESGTFLAVLFPHTRVQVLPYHRVLLDLNGHSEQALNEALGRVFTLVSKDQAQPLHPGDVGVYLGGHWRTLRFRAGLAGGSDPVEALDVSLLQNHVLRPLFGIEDPRTSQRIQFVGGIRGTGELQRLVDSGQAKCAFALFPTRVEDLIRVADAGGIMPPKSTWFEPKLRDGMFSHLI